VRRLRPCTSGSCSAFSAASGLRVKPSPKPIRKFCRLARVSVFSVSSTWSSWTGSDVCVIGSVAPECSTLAEGLPGCSSANQLPSRKVRGRILTVASEWIGSPSEVISMLSTPALPSRETEVTLPTSTPAIPHRRGTTNGKGAGEDRFQAEVVFERDVLGEAEEHDDSR